METTVVVLDATTGARVAAPERRYGENWRTSDDLLVLEGTADDLTRLAEAMEKRARTPGYQSNATLRMARELRDAAAEAAKPAAEAAFASPTPAPGAVERRH